MRSEQENCDEKLNGVTTTRGNDTQRLGRMELSDRLSTDADDMFSDARTYQKRLGDQNTASQESLAEIFSSHTFMSSQSQQDQFAAAIMRLQVDLSSTGERLSTVERKLEKFIQEQRCINQRYPGESPTILDWLSTSMSWFQLAWPVAVYLLMLTLEKRLTKRERSK